MCCTKEFYDQTTISKGDLEGRGLIGKIQLEYYKTTNDILEKERYGINIIKKQRRIHKQMIESKQIDNISKEETQIENLLQILVNNKVTPIGLEDVLADLIGN